jgi:hypothetical protein
MHHQIETCAQRFVTSRATETDDSRPFIIGWRRLPLYSHPTFEAATRLAPQSAGRGKQ